MINISYQNNKNLYEDFEACVDFLEQIDEKDFEYPDNKVKFHIYSEIKTPKELMAVKSYLATQKLKKTELEYMMARYLIAI